MKLSESFGLIGTATFGDSDGKYDRYLPRLNRDGSIAFANVDGDGSRIQAMPVREIMQWVSTLEDNDDLGHAMLSMGKRKLRTFGKRSTMYVTDARVVFAQEKLTAPDERVVGHVRYPWIDGIAWRPRLGRSKRPMLQLWMHEDFPVKYLGTWYHYVELEFDETVNTAAIALDLARRVSAHNLAHGAPAWIHDQLREQSHITQLPESDDNSEGLWQCPASVACPYGAEYIDDSPPHAEWIGRGAEPPEPELAVDPDETQQSAPSTLILKRMLARGKSIARERGNQLVGTDDLLLALLIDPDTPLRELMERHGIDYDSAKLQLEASRPRYEVLAEDPLRRKPIQVGKQRPGFAVVRGALDAMAGIDRCEEASDLEGALEYRQQLLMIAQQSGISTLRAFAEVQVGGSYLALGRLNEAHNAFGSAAMLHSAPTVNWSGFVPKMEPIEIVDDALYGLCKVANERNDASAEIAALERLHGFRSRYGSDTSTGWTAAALAQAHDRNHDFPAAVSWAEIAVEKYERAGDTVGAADAARMIAGFCNGAGEPARALVAAERAITSAVLAGEKQLEARARFERARANSALGNTAAAWEELRALLPDARQHNPAQARAIVIHMAEIDPVVAATEAIELADTDVVFYGPRSAEIAETAARALLDDDADAAQRLLIHSIRIAAAVLTSPETVGGNVDRAFTTLGNALTSTDDPQFTQRAIELLVGPLRRLDPKRLYRADCLTFLQRLEEQKRFDVLVTLATPITDRIAESLASEAGPSGRHMVHLVRRKYALCRGLRLSGQREAAMEVQEDLINWMRKAAALAPTERSDLGILLSSHGYELMRAARYEEAHDKQSEAIDLLRSAISEGDDYWEVLVFTIKSHAELAGLTGEPAVCRARLQEALAVLDDAPAADWAPNTREDIKAMLAEAADE